MLYAAMFNQKQDLILAGGAGRNQVRIFDYETGNLVCVISDMARSVLCMDMAHKSHSFAFGSVDSCVRIMDILSS
jgi:WD40 repeat protein